MNDDKHVAPLGDPHDSEPVSQATIDSWRINYGLDKRNPSQAAQWWCEHAHGMAPAGAVAALGIALDALEAAQTALKRIAELDPDTDSDEGYNEWGEADCFNQAQKIAAAAMGGSMTDLERLAREAGLHNDGQWWFDGDSNAQCDVSTAALARFAALVRAQALEDAARVCESWATEETLATCDNIAAAIRAL